MNIWSHILQWLDTGKRVMLMVVIESEGSSPGREGFKMAVCEDGSLTGTIGGGISEFRMVEMAKLQLKDDHATNFSLAIEHNLDSGEKSSGMICSGKQTIAFYPLGAENRNIIESFARFSAKPQPFYLWYTQFGIKLIAEMNSFEKNPYVRTSFTSWEFTEAMNDTGRIYIFGAGHVGFALSRIMQVLDFHIELFDDREWLDTYRDNTFVTKKQIVDFKHVEDLVPEGDDVYAVIMTYAHLNDETVLRQLIGKNIRYLGMLGSRYKVKTLFDNLIQEGISPEQIAKVHAPVGISINSMTPAEIAVSIAAEIISVKNGPK